MFARPSAVHLRLAPEHAETLCFELLGLLAHYRDSGAILVPQEEAGLLSAIAQLELGIKRAEAAGQLQLEQLRAAALRKEVA